MIPLRFTGNKTPTINGGPRRIPTRLRRALAAAHLRHRGRKLQRSQPVSKLDLAISAWEALLAAAAAAAAAAAEVWRGAPRRRPRPRRRQRRSGHGGRGS